MPPSIGIIVYGLLTDTSIAGLFVGGVVPALLIAAALLTTVRLAAIRRGYRPERERPPPAREVLARGGAALWALAMPVLLIVGLRGGGWFTPTELGAIAAAGALAVGLVVYRGLRPADLLDLLRESARTTANVLFIVAEASVLLMILALEQIPQRLAGALLSVSDARVAVLLFVNAMLLVLGTVLEGLALMIILAPVFVELTAALDLDPVHLGVVIVLNTTIGSITRPVGTVLYTVCSITRCPIEEFAREAAPFLAALVAVLLLLTLVPGLVTALPAVVLG